MSTNEKPTIKSIVPALGCLRQSWVVGNADGQGASIDTHHPVIGLALLDDGTLNLVVEFNGEVELRADAEAWAISDPQIAPGFSAVKVRNMTALANAAVEPLEGRI